MTYGFIGDMLQITEALMRGYCFYRLMKPFMRRAFYVGVMYVLVILFLHLMPLYVNVYAAYVVSSAAVVCSCCLADRRNYRQKLFLVTVFFSINWLSAAMAEILYDNLYAFAENTEYMRSQPDMMWRLLYAGVCFCYLVLEFSFTAIGIWQVTKAYRNKSADMKTKELVMLSIPSFLGVMAYQMIRNYRGFYMMEGGESKAVYEFLSVLFCVVCVIAIVIVIVLYQDIMAKQEENRQAAALAMQIDNIKRHIGQVETLYQNIRGIKHDMTNHILTLERLYEDNRAKEAIAYGTELKTALTEMTGEIASGNAVTDVIVQEWQKEAQRHQISFRSEFYYPTGTDINAFDISVILNNALQNAVEYAQKSENPYLSVRSYHRNNAYMIEVCNSFDGEIRWDAESGLPATSKEKAEGHGYGLSNIRRVARKYSGDIVIDVKDGEFRLSIMLMME